MFTDMVGYSALTHSNEQLSFELLKEHRALVRSLVQEFHGREIATPGDAFVVEFSSTVEAVDCAIEIQKTFAQRNTTTSSERKIQLRIGIHIGDVLGLDNDIYGDGVNIAARLQPLAPAGTICISQAVYYQVQNRLNNRVTYLGKPRLKGIKKQLRAYVIETEEASFGDRFSRFAKRAKNFRRGAFAAASIAALIAVFVFFNLSPKALHVFGVRDHNRVAVLPIQGLGFQPSDDYLSEGLTDELVSGLSHQSGLRVLANGSVSNYKHAQKTPAQIGADLNVGILVEGTVKRVGENLKVTISLVDTVTQENIWNQNFEGKEKEIFNIQNKIVSQVITKLKGRDVANIPSTGVSVESPNQDAYLAYLKGRYFLNKRTKDGLSKGQELLLESVHLDPQFAPAYAALANGSGLQSYYGLVSPIEASAKVVQFATQALSLDPGSSEAMISLAEEKAYVEYDYVSAEKMFRRAIQANPRQATVHQWFGEFLSGLGRFREASKEIDLAVSLDPLSLVANVARGASFYTSRNYDEAIKTLTSVREMDPGFMLSYYWTGKAYLAKGDVGLALKNFEKAAELSGQQPFVVAALASAYARAGQADRAQSIFKELNEISKKQYVSPYQFAQVEVSLGNFSQALDYLQRAVRERASQAASIWVDPELDPLRKDPQFTALASQVRAR